MSKIPTFVELVIERGDDFIFVDKDENKSIPPEVVGIFDNVKDEHNNIDKIIKNIENEFNFEERKHQDWKIQLIGSKVPKYSTNNFFTDFTKKFLNHLYLYEN